MQENEKYLQKKIDFIYLIYNYAPIRTFFLVVV